MEEQNTTPKNTTPETPKNNKNQNLIIGIVVAAVILAITSYFLFLIKKEKHIQKIL